VLVLLLACNLELLPLALLVDAIGLDVLALLLGAQLVAALRCVRANNVKPLRMARLMPGAVVAAFMGGYLRQFLFGLCQGTVIVSRAHHDGHHEHCLLSALPAQAQGFARAVISKLQPSTHRHVHEMKLSTFLEGVFSRMERTSLKSVVAWFSCPRRRPTSPAGSRGRSFSR